MRKLTLYCKESMCPRISGRVVEIDADRVLMNDWHYPGDYNPHNIQLWIIGNEFAVMAAAWGNEQDALDEAWDADLLQGIAVNPDDVTDDDWENGNITGFGNASEPGSTEYLWMQSVDLTKTPRESLVALAYAAGATQDTVDA